MSVAVERHHWTSPDLRTLEARLLEHANVHDCVVLPRTALDGQRMNVAYVVAVGPLTLDALRAHARDAGSELLPDALVRVSNLPLDPDGRVDEALLASLPVLDATTLDRTLVAIRAAEGVADAELVAELPTPAEVGLRVDVLLPGWSRAPERTAPRAQRADHVDAPPSLSIGEPLDWGGGERPRNVAALLERAATLHPAHDITCLEQDGEHVFTYVELRDRAERIMAGLRAAGVRAGDIVIFQFDRNPDFIAAFWGCMLGGFVPAPISVSVVGDATSAAATKLKNSWHLLGGPVVLTSADLAPTLARMKEPLELPDLRVLVVDDLLRAPAGEPWHDAQWDDLALLLLTSGSTGKPKAVTQTNGALVSQVSAMAQRNSFTADEVSLNWFPLDHVGGIVMFHLRDVAMCARQVQARTDYVLQDALRWLDLIERFRATITWAPNFAFGLVNDRGDEVATRRWDLSSMGFILNGGEAIVAATSRRFLRRLAPHGLPATSMRPAWGMSETCSAATFSPPFRLESTSDADEFVEVGQPNPGFEIRIVNDEQRIVPEGREGNIEVRGAAVTRGYLNNPEANATALAGEGWFRTGDLGRLVSGRLTITGREKGEIIVNGVNYHAHEVEAAVEDVAGVTPSFAAAFAVREPGANTDSLAIAFHTSSCETEPDLIDLLRRMRLTVLERVGVAPRYLLPVTQDDIPKTAIGKIQRSALTKRFAEGGLGAAVRRSEALMQRAETIPDWFFRPIWRQRAAVSHRPVGADCAVFIVADDHGVDDALTRAVERAGARATVVSRAELASRIADTRADERVIVAIGDSFGAETASDEAAMALAAAENIVALVRALASARQGAGQIEMVVYDDRVQHVVPGDRVAVAKASTLAMLRTVAAEQPGISVRHVDLPDAEPARLAQLVINELADRTDEPEVAYRGDARWVRRLEKRAATPSRDGRTLGKTNGFILVTGGLGGIGTEVCRQILRSSDTPLLLIGRRALGADERQATLASLELLGTVQFEAIDVADFDALEHAVAAASERWGRPLGGVIHLAGVFAPRVLADETPATLASSLRAKVQGTWNLHRVLLRYPDATLLAFSSVNGHLGGYGAGAYAAANAFVDAVVQHHVADLGRPSHSLGWSLWDDVGMSRELDLRESAARRGYRAVSIQQGVISLVAAAGSEPGHVLIGLDAANPHVRLHLENDVASDTLTAYWTRAKGADAPVPASVEDSFGVAVPLTVREVGDAELASVRGGGRAPTGAVGVDASTDASFGNDLERAIAAVWREVLSAGRIAPNDNFFDIGGTSLLVATATRKLERALGRTVSMTDIYRFPTLRLLAAYFGGDGEADAAGLDDSEERGKARRAQRMQRRRRSS